MSDVSKQAHYTQGSIEPIEYIFAQGDGPAYCRGNIIKYVSRHRSKNGAADLLKARHFIDLLIELEYPAGAQKKQPPFIPPDPPNAYQSRP